MTSGSSEELAQNLLDALNAWRRSGVGFLVLMLQVHPSERRGISWTTTQRGLQLELARRLRSVASVGDKLFLLDDATVVVVCPHVVGGSEARRMAERFTSEASQPSRDTSALPIEVSSGAVLAAARHDSPETVLADAETAMRRAAAGTGTQFAFSDGPLWSDLVDRLSSLDPRCDADAGGFHLDYQPIVAAADRSLWGMEALLRWEGAASARRSVLDLVHVAEQTGWIEPLRRWVMREATSQAHGWTRAGASDLMIFVNVSAIQLSSARFIEDIDETLRITGLSPTLLGLDIPTSALSADPNLEIIHALRDRGVTIALDDFEVKAPAIRSLEEMPVDIVKLDATAADALGGDSARSLLAGTVSWAHQLGLTVIAKSVEDQSQLTLAVEVGFDHLQGLLLSPPLERSTLEEFITGRLNGES